MSLPGIFRGRHGQRGGFSPVVAMLLPCVVASCVLGVGATASAQPESGPALLDDAPVRWPTSAEDEEERLGRFLEAQRAAELRQHWAVAIGAVAIGAPQVALGEYMIHQRDPSAEAIGPGMIVGGAADCFAGLVPLLAPTPMSILLRGYESERAAGRPASDVVRDTEENWRALVSRQRSARRVAGIVQLLVGVPAFTTGLVFAFAKPGLAGMSASTQYGWAGALTGADFAIYQGVVLLAAPPPIDTAFDTYELLKHGSGPGFAPKIGFVPVTGGGAISVGAVF